MYCTWFDYKLLKVKFSILSEKRKGYLLFYWNILGFKTKKDNLVFKVVAFQGKEIQVDLCRLIFSFYEKEV